MSDGRWIWMKDNDPSLNPYSNGICSMSASFLVLLSINSTS